MRAECVIDVAYREELMLDERTCDATTCLSAARLRLTKDCGYELLVCARHRRQFDSWTGVVDNHGHPIQTPAKWSNV